MICTFYSHEIGFDRIVAIIHKTYPSAHVTTAEKNGSSIAEFEIKGGLFSSAKKLKVVYRQRAVPSYDIPEIDDSPLTGNLKGLYGYVSGIASSNEKVKGQLLEKIRTINSEFSVQQVEGESKELKNFINELAQHFDAVLFTQPDTVISRSNVQHLLDRNLRLIIDTKGHCEIDGLDVSINSIYFDGEQNEPTEDQKMRKTRNEEVIAQRGIPVNKNLPFIDAEETVLIRSAKEVAERTCVLAVTNLVAFNTISTEEAIDYLQKYKLWNHTTQHERDFLTNPTEEWKNQETWKCECIWTLMWAMNKVQSLGFPDEMCSLDNIGPATYPIGPDKDPNDFITSVSTLRTAGEILDANDFYYRLNWACVEMRIKNVEMTKVNPSIVYERHYALNWLITYMDQDWDDVTCDT